MLTAGLGGMGGAQPLAITMNEGVGLIVEVDPARASVASRWVMWIWLWIPWKKP